jgi:hypothetical protein
VLLQDNTLQSVDMRIWGVSSLNGKPQDNARYAFLQMDDRALIYRGVDQPDMSVINPESDVWQHVKVGPFSFALVHNDDEPYGIPDPSELSRQELPDTVFFAEQRRAAYCSCWTARTHSLQHNFWSVEAFR